MANATSRFAGKQQFTIQPQVKTSVPNCQRVIDTFNLQHHFADRHPRSSLEFHELSGRPCLAGQLPFQEIEMGDGA